MGNAWIVGGARTARGRGKAGKGSLSGVHPQELLGQTLNEVIARTKVDANEIDDVIAGCVSQAKEQGACIARNSVLAAALPDTMTGVTVNRFCGSGLQALNFGAMGVASGHQSFVLAGGVESMSRVPMGSDEAGIDGNNLHLRKRVFQVPQGISADLIATIEGFSRADVDAFALESQRRAEIAQKDNRFAKAIFVVKDPETGKQLLDFDEHARHGTTIEALTKLEGAFVGLGAAAVGANGETLDQIAMKRYPDVKKIEHVHTAGNSSGIVDGACALLLASDDAVKAHGLKPRARIRSMATIGAEPVIMLTAPAPASERALKKAGMKASDIDLWEINEAFATVPMQTMRKLGIDHAKVNVNGGAIALGHPLGATGAILALTAIDELERRGLGTALITLCIGGGMGIATVIERV
jgi:acetyl-CoA C-acetyltransferase